jgi:hypothetical protein
MEQRLSGLSQTVDFMERETGIEPATFSLGSLRSLCMISHLVSNQELAS